jgi:hypothetical protein
MRPTPHPNPQLRRLGRTLAPGTVSLEPAAATRQATRSSLTDIFPTLQPALSGGFSSIPIPAGTLAGLVAGNSAWWPLIDVPVDSLGQEVLLMQYTLNQISTYSTASGANAAWGDVRGEAAAIVIGDGRLPISGKIGWQQGPCSIPGIEASPTIVQNDSGRYIAWHKFPPGTWSDTIPFKTNLPRSFAPWVWRFGFGTRIQVALVVRGTQIAAGAGKTLVGDASIQLHLGGTINTQRLTT